MTKSKHRLVTWVLAFFLGSVGVHHFYLGFSGPAARWKNIFVAVVYIILFFRFTPAFPIIFSLIECVRIWQLSDDEFFDLYPNNSNPTAQPSATGHTGLEELEKANRLRIQGVIGDAEFNQIKSRIIAKMNHE